MASVQISIRLNVGEANVVQACRAVTQESVASRSHEVCITLEPGLLVHPRDNILEETLDLLVITVAHTKFGDPNGLASHLIRCRGVILEVLDVVPVTVPVNGDEIDLAITAGI